MRTGITAMGTPASGQPGAVAVRMIGDPDACAALALLLAGHPGIEVVRGPRGPYACDETAQVRWYVTLRLATGLPGAGRRTAAKQSAAPLPRPRPKENPRKEHHP